MALALTRMTSLLEKSRLSIFITKDALRPGDRYCLNAVEMDDLYDNIVHSAMESVLRAYIAKERDKALRRKFGAQEANRNFLREKYSRLKTRVEEVDDTIKETLKSVDKLQADLDEANN